MAEIEKALAYVVKLTAAEFKVIHDLLSEEKAYEGDCNLTVAYGLYETFNDAMASDE